MADGTEPEPKLGELVSQPSAFELREEQRVALLEGVDLASVRFLKLASSGDAWEPVSEEGISLEGRQSRVLVWRHADGRPHRALADELVAIGLANV